MRTTSSMLSQCSSATGTAVAGTDFTTTSKSSAVALPVDLRDARFDVAQPRLLLVQRTLDLGRFMRQHAAQLGRRDLVLQQRADLLERQAELLQRQDAVQPRQLPDACSSDSRSAGRYGPAAAGRAGRRTATAAPETWAICANSPIRNMVRGSLLSSQERLQVLRHAIAFGDDDAMRGALIGDQCRSGDAAAVALPSSNGTGCRRCRAAPVSAP